MLKKNSTTSQSRIHGRKGVAVLLSFLLLTISGCEYFNSPKPARIGEEQRFLVHLVTNNNESFSRISKWYTGSEKLGRELATLNTKTAANGLQIGESVLIPFANLKTVAPMPKIVSTRKGKSTKKGKKKGGTPTVLESVELESSEIEIEQNTPETFEVEVHQNQPMDSYEEVQLGTVGEEKIPGDPHTKDVVPLPTAQENEIKGGDDLGNGGKSLEDLVREEQAELERLKREMGAQ